MYRRLFLAIARDRLFKKVFMACPLTKTVVRRFVPGEDWEDARAVVTSAVEKGLLATVAHLGADARTVEVAQSNTATYLDMVHRVRELGWTEQVDIAINLVSLGLMLRNGEQLALDNVMTIADSADQSGVRLIIDMENPLMVAKAMRVVEAVRQKYSSVAYAVQANLKRTEADCRNAGGARVRLCKGSYSVPAQALYADPHDVDLSFVRCLKTLMEGEGPCLVATHDPVMIEIADELAAHSNRGLHDFEFQMLHGIRSIEQERLADLGHLVRVYVPFGRHWYDYAVRRFAERPGNLWLFVRALFGHR